MLGLIIREIRDNLVHVLGLGVISILTTSGLVYVFLRGVPVAALVFSGLMLVVLLPWLSLLGTAQMYSDRAHRISTLLSTLAVTRNRILLARVFVGILVVLGVLLPPLLTGIVLLRFFLPPWEFYGRMAVEIALTTILTGVAYYCIGLMVGWTTNRVWLLVGNILALVLCASLIAVKGCGREVMAILLVFSAAALARTWHKFLSASL
jgi:hypothetical protein